MPTLSEAASKRLLAAHGVTFADDRVVASVEDAVTAAGEIGFPVVVKLGGDGLAHKTERGLVRLGLDCPEAVERAAEALLAAASPDDGPVHLLVSRMVHGQRELLVGLHRDEIFGPVVVLGIGGVLAEALSDVSCRLAPIDVVDGVTMIDDLRAQALLGSVRGEPPVDRLALAHLLVTVSKIPEVQPEVVSIDINPVIIADAHPVPVDALVVLGEQPGRGRDDAES